MSPAASWAVVAFAFTLTIALVIVLVRVEQRELRRYGSRRRREDELAYLRAHERYRAALARQHEQHIRLGHHDQNTGN